MPKFYSRGFTKLQFCDNFFLEIYALSTTTKNIFSTLRVFNFREMSALWCKNEMHFLCKYKYILQVNNWKVAFVLPKHKDYVQM